jgi:acetoin utilization protein AcuB
MKVRQRHPFRRGTSVVEYVVFLALVAGALLLAIDAASVTLSDSLSITAAATRGDAKRGDFHPRHDDLNLASQGAPAFPVARFSIAYRDGVIAIFLSLTACVWYALHLRRKQPRPIVLVDSETAGAIELQHEILFEKRHQILRILSSEMNSLLESRLEVRHLMSRALLRAKPQTTLTEIHEVMNRNHVKHLLVCDESGQLRGIISDRDLLSRRGQFARDIMSIGVVAIEPQALVMPAITLLMNKRISCLPVVQDGVPVGILTTTDLMMALQCSMQVLQRVAAELRRPSPATQRISEDPVSC